MPKNAARRGALIYAEFTGNNHGELAQKYDLSTAQIYRIVRDTHKAMPGKGKTITRPAPVTAKPQKVSTEAKNDTGKDNKTKADKAKVNQEPTKGEQQLKLL